MNPYRSSVLLCDVGDDGCPVCLFLAGDKSTGVLLNVIEVLDKELADLEKWERSERRNAKQSALHFSGLSGQPMSQRLLDHGAQGIGRAA